MKHGHFKMSVVSMSDTCKTLVQHVSDTLKSYQILNNY